MTVYRFIRGIYACVAGMLIGRAYQSFSKDFPVAVTALLAVLAAFNFVCSVLFLLEKEKA